MIKRSISRKLEDAWADTPVVLLVGARQTGKTTLATDWAKRHEARYETLDDATVLATAAADPQGFVNRLELPAVIDEVQKVPELLPAIKLRVGDSLVQELAGVNLAHLKGARHIPGTLKRKPRPSAYLLRDIARANAVAAGQFQKYVAW